MNSQPNLGALRRWALATTIALLSACGGGGDDDPGPVARECGADGYPCSLDKVSRSVLERGEALADELVALLGKGQSMADVLAFIRAQAGVVDAASSEVAIRFRLAGGRDVFIFQPAALSPVTASGARVTAANRPAREAPREVTREVAKLVAGESTDTKRALVLSPFKYFFAPDDDGAPVAQLLENTRGYAGNVTYLENATETSATVGIQQFAGWQAFDVIHVTSHGARVCDVNRCTSVILSGDIYSNAEDLLKITEAGVNTARVAGSDAKLLTLSPEFFKQKYPAGLDRKIIFFNACQTYGEAGSALSDVLLGQQSVFLGWTDVVENDAARNAALALFQNLSASGITVDAALDALGGLGINHHSDDGREVNAVLLLDRGVNTGLRLREVVTLERPNGGGKLFANNTVEAVGTAQDGTADMVPYQVLIEGIPADQQDAAIVQFRVNGHSSTPQAVTIGERVGETGWRLTGQIPFIDVAPEQVVEMVATVQLPEGGTSEHRVSVKLTAGAGAGAETWVGEAVSHFDDSTPEGQVHVTRVASVTFKQSLASVGGRYKVLRSTIGSMQWSRSGTIKTLFDGDCAYSTGTVEVPIPAGDGEIIIDTAGTGTYSLSGFTPGVEVRLAEHCGNYAFSTRAGGAWGPAVAPSDGFTVSSDGGLIAGTTGGKQTTWTWTFRRQ